jgi:hypothetical protein
MMRQRYGNMGTERSRRVSVSQIRKGKEVMAFAILSRSVYRDPCSACWVGEIGNEIQQHVIPNTRVDTNTRITKSSPILSQSFLFSCPHTRVIRDVLSRVPRQHPGHRCISITPGSWENYERDTPCSIYMRLTLGKYVPAYYYVSRAICDGG